MINCFGYVVLSVTALFFPAYYEAAFKMAQPVFIRRIGDHAVAFDQGRKGTNFFKCASASNS
jgi:hypothetical protein